MKVEKIKFQALTLLPNNILSEYAKYNLSILLYPGVHHVCSFYITKSNVYIIITRISGINIVCLSVAWQPLGTTRTRYCNKYVIVASKA